jgi:hypothetical protein
VLCFPSQGRDLLLSPLLLRNIPRDFRCADDIAAGVFNGGDGQRNEDQAAVLASPNRLEVIDTLPASYAR